MSEDISVTFEHWSYVFPDELLSKYGSPHFSQNEAAENLIPELLENAISIYSSAPLLFSREQILSANEAFPEAAVADPIADLEVWDDWRLGIRAFPYPGIYGPLGIRNQENKTTSTSSVGVIGEIMTGIFAQAGLSPWMLVRVIRRWPDFIYYLKNDRYAFVESKAFTKLRDKRSNPVGLHNVPSSILGESLVHAVSQLNSDPFVQVWYSFTAINSINPFKLKVIFLELDAEEHRRQSVQKRILPEPVVKGLADRALSLAATKIKDPEILRLADQSKIPPKELDNYKEALTRNSMLELENLFIDNELKVAVLQSRSEIEKRIYEISGGIRLSASDKAGGRMFEAMAISSNKGLAKVRDVGANSLYIWNMNERSIIETSKIWRQNAWDRANAPWKETGSVKLWLCGGAVFAIGKGLDGININ